MERSLNRSLLSFLTLTSLLVADVKYNVTNTNFTVNQEDLTFNYDRLRVQLDYSEEEYFSTIIADGVNFYSHKYINSPEFQFAQSIGSDTPFKTATSSYEYGDGTLYAKLYRAYTGYEDDKNRVIFGLQNITTGVGRIWNPTNLFNPRNSFALEPDEVFGVLALHYTRNLDDLSRLSLTVSEKKDRSLKYALQYKAFLEFADVALNAVSSNETKMFGYEFEANLFESGIEVRNESAYIKSQLSDGEKDFVQSIVGADYGFEDGITLLVETYYSSKTFGVDEVVNNYDAEVVANLVNSNFYGAVMLSYGFNLLFSGSISYIESFNDKNSRFISPNLTYGLDDFNTLSVGAMLFNGKSGSEFAEVKNSYYLNYTLSF